MCQYVCGKESKLLLSGAYNYTSTSGEPGKGKCSNDSNWLQMDAEGGKFWKKFFRPPNREPVKRKKASQQRVWMQLCIRINQTRDRR
ncbi:MAG: hypothetical protein DRH06_01230 [Deltaproteobacteria bacterium]|nr:MAG: hypothetical protein DRH06_01230 [Deltaproteobacteria bacterium]